jgi:hypothetical protein
MTRAAIGHVEVLRSSVKFQEWRPSRDRFKVSDRESERSCLMAERHYSPSELGKLWGVDAETIRNIFRNESDVLKLGNSNGKRPYVTLRIPESVAERVHKKLSS